MSQPRELTAERVRDVIGELLEPKLQWTLSSLGLVRSVDVDDERLSVEIHLITADPKQTEQLRGEASRILQRLGGGRKVVLSLARVNVGRSALAGVSRIVLVGSGKGGVGKSSVATNLAAALRLQGHRVGLMDADIYGPSIPLMMGLADARPEVLADEFLMPIEAHGIKTMSVGYLVGPTKAMDWRGPMTSGTLLQFVRQTLWQELDYLVVDLPPGTGDAQLTLAHSLRTDGLVVVTTPQEVALGDVRRAVAFYQEREVPILGLVENMSGYQCEHCGHTSVPFQRRDARRIVDDPLAGLPLLARIPLAPAIAASGDEGEPIVLRRDAGPLAELYDELAAAVVRRLLELQQVEERAAAG